MQKLVKSDTKKVLRHGGTNKLAFQFASWDFFSQDVDILDSFMIANLLIIKILE